MNKNRKAEIKRLANELHKALKLEVPYNPKKAIEELGGKVNEIKDLDVDCKIKSIDNSFIIEIKAGQAKNRKRFSLAHELGHLFIHMGFLIDEAKWENATVHEETYNREGYNTEEYEANEFAANFLMPENEFREFIVEHRQNGKINIDDLGNHFQVSTEAVLNRGKWLSYFNWD